MIGSSRNEVNCNASYDTEIHPGGPRSQGRRHRACGWVGTWRRDRRTCNLGDMDNTETVQ